VGTTAVGTGEGEAMGGEVGKAVGKGETVALGKMMTRDDVGDGRGVGSQAVGLGLLLRSWS